MKVEVNGIKLDCRDEGEGLPVIFVHAFPLNQTMWDDQVAALRTACRVITLDLRGFGRSGFASCPHSIEQMASDVRGLMKVLAIDRTVLVGLSMGGYISLAFYRSYPECVHAMVLADTRASADTEEARERRIKSAEKAEREGSAAIADDVVPQLLGRSTLSTRPDLIARTREMVEANSPAGIAAAQRAMAARRDSMDLLVAMNIPVLVIVGSEDSLTPAAEAETMHRAIRGSRLQVIKGAGHLSNLEQPDMFSAALSEFLSLIEARS
ncbi:MAG TPA: alpha/beta fold hydrolase [Blastocatellia bacterium]|nr:alpha/beta fold hydrolase [Blastocatellia bacterium]